MNLDVISIAPEPPLRGGIAAHGARLGEAFERAGHRVEVEGYRRIFPAALLPPAAPALGSGRLDALGPRSWLALRQRLRARGADLVVAEYWHPIVAPCLAAALSGRRRETRVLLCHNARAHESAFGSRAALRMAVAAVDSVVCHGPSVAAEVRGLVPGARVAEVPLPPLLRPAVLAAALGGRGEPPEARADASFEGCRLVVAPGLQRPYKALDVLMEAWRRARRPPSARLLVAGAGYLGARRTRALADAATNDPSIVYWNRYLEDEEFAWILARAEVVVAAHAEASQSGVVALAAALAKTVIVSDAGSLAAQSPAAKVVAAANAASLAEALSDVLATSAPPRGDHGPDARADLHRRDEQSWNAVVEAIVAARRP